MNVLVFTTTDLTPEQWSDFATTAAVPANPNLESEKEPLIPYALVSSSNPPDTTRRTSSIDAPVKTQLKSASDADIRSIYSDQVSRNKRALKSQFYILIDAQSLDDHAAVLVQKKSQWVDADGNVDAGGPAGRDDLTQQTTWRKHRIPFDKVQEAWTLLDAKGFVEDEYLVDVTVED